MSFDSFGDFLAMGGHGLYVWLAYGSSLIVIGANVVSVRRERRRFFAEARAIERRRRGLDPAAAEVRAPVEQSLPGAQTGKPIGS